MKRWQVFIINWLLNFGIILLLIQSGAQAKAIIAVEVLWVITAIFNYADGQKRGADMVHEIYQRAIEEVAKEAKDV